MDLPQLPFFFWIAIGAALIFDFTNGWNDSANAIATVISTRVMRPVWALMMSAVLNCVGAFISTKVAKSVGGGIVNPELIKSIDGSYIVFAAMVGASLWVTICTLKGLPISCSHALIGGLIGSAISIYGVDVLKWGGVVKILIAILVSPLLGLILGIVVLRICYLVAVRMKPGAVRKGFSVLQLLTSATMSVMHGQNDAQKVMGVITLLLFVGGYFGDASFKDVPVPIWVTVACAASMGLGTAIGGWGVIKTLGMKLSHLRPIEGAAAEISCSAVLEGAAALGVPVSTTHTITGSIVGVGIGKRLRSVKWGIGMKIVYAWIFTLPASAIFAGLLVRIIYWLR